MPVKYLWNTSRAQVFGMKCKYHDYEKAMVIVPTKIKITVILFHRLYAKVEDLSVQKLEYRWKQKKFRMLKCNMITTFLNHVQNAEG